MPALLPIAPGDEGCWRTIGTSGDRSCPRLGEVVHCHNCPVFSEAGRRLLARTPPEGYLAAWTALLAEEKAPAAKAACSVLVFRIGAEWLALDTAHLVEVAETRTVHRVAHRTGGILDGIVNIRGQLQLCVSLRRLLGIGSSGGGGAVDKRRRLIVMQRGKDAWVFDADEVHGVERFARELEQAVPATVAEGLAGFSRGIFLQPARNIGHLDGDALFGALKKAVG